MTRLVDDACIFLNRPGSPQGAGCALHVAALEAGERPLDWKPNVCWQLPLRLEHSTDENGHVTSRLRDWKRRDWGDGGHEFHWWCTEAPGGLQRQRAGVRVGSRRDRRTGRRADLRPARHRPGWQAPTGATDARVAAPAPSLLVVGVVFELDAVALGNRRVLVLFGDLAIRRRRGAAATIAESEVERPRSRLLQLSRFFEAAMTTLLHAGLPTN